MAFPEECLSYIARHRETSAWVLAPARPSQLPPKEQRRCEKHTSKASGLQLSGGKLRGKPATRGFDEPFTPTPDSNKRIARQYKDQLPPQFPTASLYSGVVHPLSGLASPARTQILVQQSTGRTGGWFRGEIQGWGEPEGQTLSPDPLPSQRCIPSTVAFTSREQLTRTVFPGPACPRQQRHTRPGRRKLPEIAPGLQAFPQGPRCIPKEEPSLGASPVPCSRDLTCR